MSWRDERNAECYELLTRAELDMLAQPLPETKSHKRDLFFVSVLVGTALGWLLV